MRRKMSYLGIGLIVIVGIVLFWGFRHSGPVSGEESAYDISMANEFSFTVKEVEEDCIEISLHNLSAKELCWGTEYALEKCVGDVWYSVEPQVPEGTVMVWDGILYVLKGGEDKEISISLLCYEKLSKGTYRVVKRFFFEGQKASEGGYVAAEFEVN